jgi:chromosome segregation protein
MPAEARGILETKREIRDLQQRISTEQEELTQLSEEAAALQAAAANASSAISALDAEYHRLEKTAVAAEGLVQRAVDEAGRIASKAEQVGRERRKAQEELEALERRQEESRASIVRLGGEQASADERLTEVQRQLFEAREAAQVLSQRAADAKASHAALIERAAALVADVRRLEEGLTELDQRTTLLSRELADARGRIGAIATSMVDAAARLAADEQALDALRDDLRVLDDQAAALRVRVDADESAIKLARAAHEEVRAAVGELDIARATAESDLNHLETACADAVQATLQDVLAEVAALEAAGETTADAGLIADEGDESGDTAEEGMVVPPARDLADPGAAVLAAERQTLSAEDAIAVLRGKIERLGPVNMMAIEQHEELESRHLFLTTQRKDLVDSIAQTTEAIKRIDETTMLRFSEAFAAINRNFQDIFSTLFGGGRAGLTLLDENNPLDSGIEIVAQPPGKRLQSVQLLSGGEKALTAISLMFSLFKYKPSPFCLLDEIDAPLDDANIGRFVEMLRGMQQHTQFILITHNRKTMEIADRLYGVTMEEPGVSKLVSVQLN